MLEKILGNLRKFKKILENLRKFRKILEKPRKSYLPRNFLFLFSIRLLFIIKFICNNFGKLRKI